MAIFMYHLYFSVSYIVTLHPGKRIYAIYAGRIFTMTLGNSKDSNLMCLFCSKVVAVSSSGFSPKNRAKGRWFLWPFIPRRPLCHMPYWALPAKLLARSAPGGLKDDFLLYQII